MPTTDELYQQYKGTSIPSFDGNSADNGQCEQWYLMVRTQRDGLGVISGNAIDRWYTQEPEYYDYIPFGLGVYPKKDDYVVWGTGVGSQYGHVDVCALDGSVTGFLGYDSNWGDVPILKTVTHNYGYGILGYVRIKENAARGDDMTVDDTLARRLLSLSTLMAQPGTAPDRQPTQAEVQNLIGRDAVQACDSLMSTSPWGDNWNKVKHYDEDVKNAGGNATILKPGKYQVGDM